MKKDVEKIFIAKGDRLSSIQITTPGTTATYITEGQVVVLDKNKKLLSLGATVTDTDVIYIAEGTAKTFNYVNEAGTTTTGARRLIYSDPIQAGAVVEFTGKTYDSPREATFTISGTFSPVVGEVYKLRILYKDVFEKPSGFTKTYQTIATSTDPDDTYNDLVTLITADTGARITASYNSSTNVMTITAKAVDDNDELTSINDYMQVNPRVFLHSDNFDDAVVTQTVYPYQGIGTWRLVRDDERWSQGYEGQTNRIAFPVIGPAFRTVKDQTYNVIILRHKNWFTTPNRREEQVDLTTKIFIPASSDQNTYILGTLNPWVESIGKGFNAISF